MKHFVHMLATAAQTVNVALASGAIDPHKLPLTPRGQMIAAGAIGVLQWITKGYAVNVEPQPPTAMDAGTAQAKSQSAGV